MQVCRLVSIDSVFKPNFICPMHNEAKQTKTSEEFGSEKGSLQGNARRRVAPDPKKLWTTQRCQQSTFKGKVRDADCWKLFGIGMFYSCNYLPRSGEDVPVNLHQDKCCCLFCKFLSIYEWTLIGRSLENKLFCVFQATGYRTWSLK